MIRAQDLKRIALSHGFYYGWFMLVVMKRFPAIVKLQEKAYRHEMKIRKALKICEMNSPFI